MRKLSLQEAEKFVHWDVDQPSDRDWYVILADFEDSRVYFPTKTAAIVFVREYDDLLEYPDNVFE